MTEVDNLYRRRRMRKLLSAICVVVAMIIVVLAIYIPLSRSVDENDKPAMIYSEGDLELDRDGDVKVDSDVKKTHLGGTDKVEPKNIPDGVKVMLHGDDKCMVLDIKGFDRDIIDVHVKKISPHYYYYKPKDGFLFCSIKYLGKNIVEHIDNSIVDNTVVVELYSNIHVITMFSKHVNGRIIVTHFTVDVTKSQNNGFFTNHINHVAMLFNKLPIRHKHFKSLL